MGGGELSCKRILLFEIELRFAELLSLHIGVSLIPASINITFIFCVIENVKKSIKKMISKG